MLVREPFAGMDREKIRRLDRWWINHVYFRPRNKEGGLIVSPKPGQKRLSHKEQFFAHWERFGLPQWRIQELFDRTMTAPKRGPASVRQKGNSPG